ncbi:MAG: DUF4381 domain-containing protein [Gammaproteobacteria bacterium]
MSPADLPLRDIHLPPAPPWWPPAPGWWVLAALALLALALIAYRIRRHRRAPRARVVRAARVALARLRSEFAAHRDPQRLAADLSVLLRRIALSVVPRAEIAGLHGERWLAALDVLAGTDEFSTGAGRALAIAPYAPHAQVDAERLLDLARTLIDRIGKAGPP